LPLSCIMKYSADTMLAMIRTKAMGTRMCMEPAETRKRRGKTFIIAPRACVCRAFPVTTQVPSERAR
jgi:hypothetical protein